MYGLKNILYLCYVPKIIKSIWQCNNKCKKAFLFQSVMTNSKTQGRDSKENVLCSFVRVKDKRRLGQFKWELHGSRKRER